MQRRMTFVTPYSRNAYLVDSESDAGITYLVDLEGDNGEPIVCTCEAFILGGRRPCKHIEKFL